VITVRWNQDLRAVVPLSEDARARLAEFAL
jgi:hypothetical protein